MPDEDVRILPLYSDTGIPSEAAMMGDILIVKKALGIQRDAPISDVADWSLAGKAQKESMGR